MPNTLSTYADFLKEGERFITAIEENSIDLPHLELPSQQLQGLVDAVRDLIARQSSVAAEKQELTRQLQDAFQNGTYLIAFLRKGVQQVYGTRGEKLVAFGLVPFRSRSRRRPLPPAPVQPTPPPPVIE